MVRADALAYLYPSEMVRADALANRCPSTLCFLWGREWHEHQHFPHHYLIAVNSSDALAFLSCIQFTCIRLGNAWSSTPVTTQLWCLGNVLLLQKHMVFRHKLHKHPNWTQHQECLFQVNSRGKLECTDKIILQQYNLGNVCIYISYRATQHII